MARVVLFTPISVMDPLTGAGLTSIGVALTDGGEAFTSQNTITTGQLTAIESGLRSIDRIEQ